MCACVRACVRACMMFSFRSSRVVCNNNSFVKQLSMIYCIAPGRACSWEGMQLGGHAAGRACSCNGCSVPSITIMQIFVIITISITITYYCYSRLAG